MSDKKAADSPGNSGPRAKEEWVRSSIINRVNAMELQLSRARLEIIQLEVSLARAKEELGMHDEP